MRPLLPPVPPVRTGSCSCQFFPSEKRREQCCMGGIRSSALTGRQCPHPASAIPCATTLHMLLRTSAFLEFLVSVLHWRWYEGDSRCAGLKRSPSLWTFRPHFSPLPGATHWTGYFMPQFCIYKEGIIIGSTS